MTVSFLCKNLRLDDFGFNALICSDSFRPFAYVDETGLTPVLVLTIEGRAVVDADIKDKRRWRVSFLFGIVGAVTGVAALIWHILNILQISRQG